MNQEQLTIDKNAFNALYIDLKNAKEILSELSVIANSDSISSENIPMDIFEEYECALIDIGFCYDVEDYCIINVMKNVDAFIYKMATIDDYFMMYYTTSNIQTIKDMVNNSENYDPEYIRDLGYKYLDELYAMGAITWEEMNGYKEVLSINAGDSRGYDLNKGLSDYLDFINTKYSDLYMNGLYKYYHSGEDVNSILFGIDTIGQLYDASNAFLTESYQAYGKNESGQIINLGFERWRKEVGLKLDSQMIDSSKDARRLSDLLAKFDSEGLSQEEEAELKALQEKLNLMRNSLSEEVSSLEDILGDFGIDDIIPMASMFLFEAMNIAHDFSVSLVQGIVEEAEGIIDGGIVALGGAASIFTALYDVGTGIFTGDWDWSTTGSLWSDNIVEWVEYDVSSWLDYAYKDKEAHQRIITIGKKIGNTGAYLFLSSASSLPVGLVHGFSTFGNKAENAYQNLSEEDKQKLGCIFAANIESLAKGVIEGIATQATYGSTLPFIGLNPNVWKPIVEGGKPIMNAIVDAVSGKEVNVGDVLWESGANIIAYYAYAISGISDKLSSLFKKPQGTSPVSLSGSDGHQAIVDEVAKTAKTTLDSLMATPVDNLKKFVSTAFKEPLKGLFNAFADLVSNNEK